MPMIRTFGPLALLASGGALLVGGCRTQDMSTKSAIAVYSYSAGEYSETVALRPDGKYVQSETQESGNPVPGPRCPGTMPLPFPAMTFKHDGTWRLLDGPGGRSLPLPTSAKALPRGAVVELHKAMPFGLTWENRPPQGLETDRTVPADDFQIQHPSP